MHRQSGISMIEVLVTIVILTFGLLGLVGLQARLQLTEMEAYQRAQALILLTDMANRISTNRANAANYVTGSNNPLGTGTTCTISNASTLQVRDSCEWSNALQGAGETSGTSKVGAMLGGRGCVQNLNNGQYLITVVWQGTNAVSAPPAEVTCGAGLYDNGTSCTSNKCRRAVTTVVRIGTLS
jgi:type IV pilus assembly protein PilV